MQLPIDFERAAVRANAAILAVAAKADKKNAGWVAAALAKLETFAQESTGKFTIEQARAAIEAELPKPHDLRAWGQVTRQARGTGLIVQDGYAPAASSNGSPKPLYRAGNA